MTLQGAVAALCKFQQSLTITEPYPTQIKAAYALPPNRAQSGLPDQPCWINVWGLTDVLNWGQLRVERYTITSQLMVGDADPQMAGFIASGFATEFLRRWDETEWDLYAETVGAELRARDPTIVTLEWGGQSYSGLQYMISIDVPVIAQPVYQDTVIASLQNWTTTHFPTWQQDPATWRPSDAAPAIYWHMVSLAAPLEEILTFNYGWQGATVAARIVAPSRIARTMHTTALSQMLGKYQPDGVSMADGSWLQYTAIRADPFVMPTAEGQLQMNVKWLLDQSNCPEDEGGEFGSVVLEWQEDPSVGDGRGPTITVTAPPVPPGP